MFIIAFPNGSRRLLVVVSASFLLLLVLAPMVRGQSADPVTAGLQWLHVSGTSIVREDGATMILRGANLPGLDPSGVSPEAYVPYLDAAKSMGFNIVRLPASWAGLEPTRGRFSTSYLNSIQKIATLSEKKEMYLVVDMHLFQLTGFPSWANFKTEDEAVLGFWSSPALQAELTQTWKTLASHLGDQKAVAGYDLLNEPDAGTILWQEFAPMLNGFYSKMIAEIRSVDSRHMIFFEPVEGTCILGDHIALKPQGANLVFSPHFYLQGPSDYLQNAASRLYNLTVNSWNIPTWIGEFGGVTVGVKDQNSLINLRFTLDLFDRYNLGWAYWSLAKTSKDPALVDGSGESSPLLTAILERIYPTSYNAHDLVFFYNSTPRFHLEASSMSEDFITISLPRTLTSTTVRCINCVFSKDDDGSALTVRLAPDMKADFYVDAPDTVTKLRELATSELLQAVGIGEELRYADLQSPRSRPYVDEIAAVVRMMQDNFAASNYELVLGKLDQVKELYGVVSDEEANYTQARQHVDSVREEILSSQGFLGEWQSTLISHAYGSLEQGNYTSSMELANKAKDLPREPAPEKLDSTLLDMLWTTSLALLGVVAVFIPLRAFRRRQYSP
jgi:endoglycosylceramidase